MTETCFFSGASFRKRVLPFVLALAAGVALSGVFGQGPAGRRKGARASAERRVHSRTWLFITSPAWEQRDAREGDTEGTVQLRLVFGEDGVVRDVRTRAVALGDGEAGGDDGPGLAAEAVEAAKSIRFRPATVDGRPVALGAFVNYSCSKFHAAHKPVRGCGVQVARADGGWRVVYE